MKNLFIFFLLFSLAANAQEITVKAPLTVPKALTYTTSSGLGVLPSTMMAVVDADFTLSDVNTAQTAFPSTMDVWTLQGSTTYYFEGCYHTTTGNAASSFGMGFALGTATLTSINYTCIGWLGTVGAVQTAQGSVWFGAVTPGAVTAAATTQGKHLYFSGIMKVNTGGTITPQVIYSVAPTGTNLMKADSYIMFTPIGASNMTTVGNVN